MNYKRYVFLLVFAGALFLSAPSFAKKSTFYFDKVYDYPQTKLKEIIENYDKGGFCAPSAASNILKTFHPGYVDQGEMIKLLASPAYMNTDPNKGTEIGRFMLGLEKYMNTELRGYKSIEYQGIGNYGKFSTGEKVPQMDWIIDGLGLKKGTWLTIHMLQHNPENDEYHFVGGHLITLVGYNVDSRNKILVVHDSASSVEEGTNKEFLHFEPIESGELVMGNFRMPAKGFLRVAKGQKIRYATGVPYDTIIITGAIRLDGNA